MAGSATNYPFENHGESSRQGARGADDGRELRNSQRIALRHRTIAEEGPQSLVSQSQERVSISESSSMNTNYRDSVQVRDIGITQLHSPEKADDIVADVVFVHGLQGHPRKTWEYKGKPIVKASLKRLWSGELRDEQRDSSSIFWPENLLPVDCKNIRILTFGYDSNITCLSQPNSKNGIFEHGGELLHAMKRHRQVGRPIIFIAHSLGGLVVKQALIDARKYAKRTAKAQLYDIYKSTHAIIFLGTPHRGANIAQWGSILSSIAGAIQIDTNAKVLKDLEPSATSKLRELVLDFTDVLEDDSREKLLIHTFQEELGMTGIKLFGGKVVPDESSSFDSREYGHQMIHANHMNMCRFNSREDDGYEKLQEQLAEYITAIKDAKIAQLQEEYRRQYENARAEIEACRNCLAFPEMDHRRLDIEKAYPETCSWILGNEAYNEWNQAERGLLWIKGKPGSGKSTLMRFALQEFKNNFPEVLTLEYFFHGRGTTLQKTPVGMFRSLLHQLCSLVPQACGSVQAAFLEKKGFANWEWHPQELKSLFFGSVSQAAKIRPIAIFIDALDEAGEEPGQAIAEYLHELNDQVASECGFARICISCRHYPITSIVPGLDIIVENENRADIDHYVGAKIRSCLTTQRQATLSQSQQSDLEYSVIERASGIFQWARLVIDLAIGLIRKGEGYNYVKQKVQMLPKQLGDLYKHILEHVIDPEDRPRSSCLFKWICFSERPLSVTEIRYALCCSSSVMHFPETDSQMETLCVSLSGGLIEILQHNEDDEEDQWNYGLRELEPGTTIQFIHQSVQDFFQDPAGLNYISGKWPTQDALRESAKGSSTYGGIQDELCKSCLNYLCLYDTIQVLEKAARSSRIAKSSTSSEELESLKEEESLEYSGDSPNREKESVHEKESIRQLNNLEREKLIMRLPFLDYSMRNWPIHAKKAEDEGHSQEYLLERFGDGKTSEFHAWVISFRLLDIRTWNYPYLPHMGFTLMHLACTANLASVMYVLVKEACQVDVLDGCSCTPLHFASHWGNLDLVKTLLSRNSQLDSKNNEEQTPLERAAAAGQKDVLAFLIQQGADLNVGNPLYSAVEQEHTGPVRILLEAGADPNLEGGEYGTALYAAVSRDSKECVQLLLEYGADVNLQGRDFNTALQAAVSRDSKEFVQLLLENRADVNLQGGEYGTALQAAAYKDSKGCIQLLLEYGTDVNLQGGHFNTALQAAACRGSKECVQLLLEYGADVNLQGGYFNTALQAAVSRDSKECVQLLLEYGADVNLQDGHFNTALQAAVSRDSKECVQLLLEYGADVNLQGGQFNTALHAAIVHGRPEILRLLLDAGVDIKVGDSRGRTPLERAEERVLECQKSEYSWKRNKVGKFEKIILILRQKSVQQGEKAITS